MSSFATRSITVNGETVEIVFEDELTIADVSTDMDKVAAQMGYWGAVWAAAAKEQEEVDAQYRAWRATLTKGTLERDPKISEWKLKALIEADPKFLKYKSAQAQATENVTLAKAVFDTFGKKANTLQSKGAMGRMEFGATGMHTRGDEPPPRKTAKAEDPERKSALRGVFKKK